MSALPTGRTPQRYRKGVGTQKKNASNFTRVGCRAYFSEYMNTQSCLLVSVRVASLQKPNRGDFERFSALAIRWLQRNRTV